MAVQATFQSMGLRSENAVSANLLLENTHESNLVSDISKVDYLAGNLGRTHLRPPPRPFDVCRRRLCLWLPAPRRLRVPQRAPTLHNRRGQLCEEHRCADIYRCPREFGDGPRWHYSLQHTDGYSSHTCNPRQRRSIRATVSRIEYDTDKKAQAKWRELYPDTEPADLFVAKVEGRCVRNHYGRAASLLASLRTPAVGPRLRHLLYRLHTGFLGGSRPRGASGPPMRFRRISRARRPGLRHARRRAHDIGEYQQRWGPCLHMGAHKQSRVLCPNVGVQQGRIELRGGRDPQTHWWPSGRLCRLPERAFATHLLASRCTGPGLHSHRSLSVRLPRGRPLGEHGQRGGGGGLGPGSPPPGSARGTRSVCGPAARQAVEEPGREPWSMSCPGRPTAGLDIRRLVRAHDNRPGLGCLGPALQGKRGQRGGLEEGHRVGRGRLRVSRMPHLPGRHSGSQRGGCRAGAAPMLYQGRRCRHNLGS